MNIIGFPIPQLIRRKREGGGSRGISKTINAFDVIVNDFVFCCLTQD